MRAKIDLQGVLNIRRVLYRKTTGVQLNEEFCRYCVPAASSRSMLLALWKGETI